MKGIEDCLKSSGCTKKLHRSMAEKGELLRSTILRNAEGAYLQAVFPAHCLLDLKMLNGLNDNFKAISPKNLKRFLQELGLTSSIPICKALKIPVVVDLRFLTGEFVYIESGDAKYLYKIATKDLDALFEFADFKKFAQPLRLYQPNISNPEHDDKDFKKIIENFTQRRIQERLETELSIPPLPASSRRLLELKNSDAKPETQKLLDVITLDPVLSSQVLRWANSPFYTRGKKVSSVSDAISRVLGVELALDLSVGLSLTQHIKLPKDGIHGYNKFWYDSLRYAIFVSQLMHKDESSDLKPGLVYNSGLLHNYGYLILAHIFPPYFSLYCRYQEANPHIEPIYLEEFLFGITRDQMAAYLFSMWDLPPELKIAIRQQHNPFYTGTHNKYANLLCISNTILNPYADENAIYEIPKSIYKNLNLNDEDILVAKNKLSDYNDEFFAGIFSN